MDREEATSQSGVNLLGHTGNDITNEPLIQVPDAGHIRNQDRRIGREPMDIEEVRGQVGVNLLNQDVADITNEQLLNLPDVGFMRDRDHQAMDLYRWQFKVLSQIDTAALRAEGAAEEFCQREIKRFTRDFGWREIPGFEVLHRDTIGSPAAAVGLDEETGEVVFMKLLLPNIGRTESILKHELAHMFAGADKLHGPEYLGYLMFMVAYGHGEQIPLSELEDFAKVYGLEWIYPALLAGR